MPTEQQLLSAYEFANKIVEQSAIFREKGKNVLVDKAWAYSNAESARRQAAKNRAALIGTVKTYPPELEEQLKEATDKAHTMCEEFANEFDAYRARRPGADSLP